MRSLEFVGQAGQLDAKPTAGAVQSGLNGRDGNTEPLG